MLFKEIVDGRTHGQRTPTIEGSQKLTEHFVLRWAKNQTKSQPHLASLNFEWFNRNTQIVLGLTCWSDPRCGGQEAQHTQRHSGKWKWGIYLIHNGSVTGMITMSILFYCYYMLLGFPWETEKKGLCHKNLFITTFIMFLSHKMSTLLIRQFI